jgi:hypothetical protein
MYQITKETFPDGVYWQAILKATDVRNGTSETATESIKCSIPSREYVDVILLMEPEFDNVPDFHEIVLQFMEETE